MGVSKHHIIYHVVKSGYDWVYLVRMVNQSNAKVIQVLRHGLEFEKTFYRKPDEISYKVGETIPLTNKGKYRRMKILASDNWEEIEEVAVLEAL